MRKSYEYKHQQHVGKTFNGLTITQVLSERDGNGRVMAFCRCICGRMKKFAVCRVISGHNKSCGECDYAQKSIYNACHHDISGMTSGDLTAIRPTISRNKDGEVMWECICKCGSTCLVPCGDIVQKMKKSCGNCRYSERRTSETFLIYKTPDEQRIYRIFHGMKSRCYNPNNNSYMDYGGRGIRICDEWLTNVRSFIDWSLSHGYADDLSIERDNVDGPYAPWNCRWIPARQQGWNKRNSRWIQLLYNGKLETKCLAEWCNILGCNCNGLHGYTDDKIVQILMDRINFGSDTEYRLYKEVMLNPDGSLKSDDELYANTLMSEVLFV